MSETTPSTSQKSEPFHRSPPPLDASAVERREQLPSAKWLLLKTLRRPRALRAAPTLPLLSIACPLPAPEQAWLKAYREICALPAGDALPLSAPQVFAVRPQLALLTDPRCPLPALGMVHCESLISAESPIVAGEPLTLRCTLDPEARWGDRGLRFSLWTELLQGDERRWWSQTEILSPRAAGSGGAKGPKRSARPPEAPDARLELRDRWSLPGDLGRRYGTIAGDRNPIHLWPWSARLFGFKRPIIHGMWSLARSLSALGGGPMRPGEQLWARFQRPIMLPGEVTLYSEAPPEPTPESDQRGEERFELWLPSGKRAIEGRWKK